MCDLEILGLKREHSSCVILLFVLDIQELVQVANALLCGIRCTLSRDTLICREQCRNEVGEKCIKELVSLRSCTSPFRVDRRLIPTFALPTHLATLMDK
jgi:hypothetical protein